MSQVILRPDDHHAEDAIDHQDLVLANRLVEKRGLVEVDLAAGDRIRFEDMVECTPVDAFALDKYFPGRFHTAFPPLRLMFPQFPRIDDPAVRLLRTEVRRAVMLRLTQLDDRWDHETGERTATCVSKSTLVKTNVRATVFLWGGRSKTTFLPALGLQSNS